MTSCVYCQVETAGVSQAYGQPAQIGDVVGCVLELEGSVKSISFSLNGQPMGQGFTLPAQVPACLPCMPPPHVALPASPSTT